MTVQGAVILHCPSEAETFFLGLEALPLELL
jgi:hypothetical protein